MASMSNKKSNALQCQNKSPMRFNDKKKGPMLQCCAIITASCLHCCHAAGECQLPQLVLLLLQGSAKALLIFATTGAVGTARLAGVPW
jgi:hypothetical protein